MPTPSRVTLAATRRWSARPHVPERALPTLIALGASIVYLACRPPSIDMAAAQYRAALFGHTGFAIWDLQWYGGHYLPAYSLLVPALSFIAGPRWLGVLAVVAATAVFQRLVEPRDRRSLAAVTLFGLGVLASLVSGRVTFTAGVPVALAALLAHERSDRPSVAVGGALAVSAATALLSPVASLFLAVAWTARLVTRRRGFYLVALVATFAPIVMLDLAFPEIGSEPLALGAIAPTAAFTVAMLGLLHRRRRDPVVAGLVVYLLSCLLTWWVHSPVGANVLRLGPLVAAPLALLTLERRRGPLLLALVAALVAWQWSDAVDDVRSASGDPSVGASFYRPLLGYLDRASGPAGAAADNGFRVEIPFTALHWEARWVAPRYALARGWERQVDIADNGLFYRPGLNAAAYGRWLHADAVRYVALPDVPLDRSARAERRIVESHPGYLLPVWHSRDWQVWEVRDATPLLSAPARLRTIGSDTITLTTPAHSSVLLRVRWNPYWAVVAGSGCVAADGDWVRVHTARAGLIRLGERFSISRIGARGPRCGR